MPSEVFRFLFIGDVFGDPGRKMVQLFVPKLREKYQLDVVVANIENLAQGAGITPSSFVDLSQAGVDVFTGGNHTYDKKEGLGLLNEEPFCLRPANYPPHMPGKGHVVFSTRSGVKFGVINLMGRTFMEALDCPFRAADTLVTDMRKITPLIMVDIHGEATSEKYAMGWYLDGRVSFVGGTHTHVQTADERILPQQTAYISDVGMTGPYDSIIGIKTEIALKRFINRKGERPEPAVANPWLCGALVSLDPKTGHATAIERIKIVYQDPSTHP